MSVDQRFLRETRSDLQTLSDQLVALEGPGADRETVDEAFRTAHTLKGNLGMVELGAASELAHDLEDLLDAVRSGERTADEPAVDAALDAVDAIERQVEAAAEGRALPDVDAAASELRSVVGTGDADEPTLSFSDVAEEPEPEPEPEPDEPAPAADEEASADTLPELDDEAAAAFEGASEFDDLDALLDEMDDDEDDLGPLEGGGSLDDLGADSTEPSPSAAPSDDAGADEQSTAAGSDGTGGEPEPEPETEPAAPGGAYDEFAAMRDEFDGEGELEELEADIAATDFGEFDDEDDMTIAELLETEPDMEPEFEVDEPDDLEDEPDVGVGEPESEPEPTRADPTDAQSASTETTTTTGGLFDDYTPDTPDGAAEADAGAEASSGATAAESVDATDDAAAVEASAGEVSDDQEPGAEDASALSDVLAAMSSSGGADATGEAASAGPAGSAGASSAEPTGSANTTSAEPTGSANTTSAETTGSADTTSAETTGSASTTSRTDDTPSFGSSSGAAGFTRDAATDDFESKFGDLFGRDEAASTGERRTATTLAESDIGGEFRTGEAGAGETLPAGLRTSGASSLTVDVEVGDELLQDVRRLGVAHRALASAVDTDDRQVRDALESIEAAVDDLRRTATTVRLVPISTVTDGFSRVVRRVARDAGVDAELRTRGTDIRLDRDVLDRIGDPLVHLVRNAVDHGIESPAERAAAGKPETGTVEVRARREGDRATIEVRDDGRGLDPATIRERAVEQGVVSAEAAADLSVSETYELVFEPGFSTADEVSETSGRGVGMDAVRQAVTDLNGTIEVESSRGEGTTIRLSVPVSVAVTEVVFVESGGRQYAVPTTDVESIQRGSTVDAADGTVTVRTPEGERAVPLVRLGETLETSTAGAPGDTGAILRVDPAVREIALGCDAVGEKREVIITPYQDVLRGTPGIGGATLLDDNTVVNVIDVETL